MHGLRKCRPDRRFPWQIVVLRLPSRTAGVSLMGRADACCPENLMRFVWCAIPLLVLSVPAASSTRGLDVRDLVSLDRVSAPVLDQHGAQLLYSLREVSGDDYKAVSNLYVRGLESDAKPKRLNPEGISVSSASFSPDAAVVYFLSAASGSSQVWSVSSKGGRARQVTDYPLDVGSYRLSPDGQRMAVSFAVFADCAADLECSARRFAAKPVSSGRKFDKLFVRHWDTWSDGSRNQLFVDQLQRGKASGKPVLVSRGIDGDVPSKPFGGTDDYSWTPDGSGLVFSARIAGRSEPWSTNFDLFLADVDAAASAQNLTVDNPAWDAAPVFDDTGRTLYYTAMKRPGFEADRMAIMAKDMVSGRVREVAPAWDRSAGSLSVSADGKTLYTLSNALGEHPLFAIDVATGEAREILGDGNVSAFAVAGEQLVFVRDTLTAPAQVFRSTLQGEAVSALTDFNRDTLATVALGDFEQFSFAGWNDETVHGYVVKPWNFEAGKRYPVAFIIHGGPQGSMGNSFHYRWNPQTYAGRGFAVVFIDFHGSTGYGQAFTDSISGDWGGKPLEDLQKGWAAALQKYDFLDDDRACALGASYGGYMVNWIAGNWREPWDCLVSHAGVFDNRMMGYSTEELWFSEWENGGTVFAKPDAYEAFNPVNHVAEWTVPMLVIHGQLDYRIPVEQGLAAFSALQRRDIPSEFLYFPDENHWILQPANSILWHDSIHAWLERWTRE